MESEREPHSNAPHAGGGGGGGDDDGFAAEAGADGLAAAERESAAHARRAVKFADGIEGEEEEEEEDAQSRLYG